MSRAADVLIRGEAMSDADGVREIVREAFGRDAEGLLVDRLREAGVIVVSLVADDQDVLVGHVVFSRLPIETDRGAIDALALGPLAVVPARQRQGIGSLLVHAGLEQCRT